MKFTIEREELLNGLNDVMKAISSKVTIPILTGIKIDLSQNGLTMTGSNSDITIRTFIPVEKDGTELIEVQQTGSIVLQARVFNDIVRKLPTNEVNIEVKEELQTTIHSGKSEFKLIGSNADDYPILPEVKEEHSFMLQSDLLKSIIRETVFAVSQHETRPILTGVHWTNQNDQLICVATDSHRLARRIIASDQTPQFPVNFVIPGKSLQELNKILSDSNQFVEILISEQQVLFKMDDVLFYSRLLEGNYPDTSRLIPEDYKTLIAVNGRSLLQSIDRASLVAKEEHNNIVRFSTEGKVIEISSNSPDVGKVEELVEADKVEGEELKISFNAKYMMDALRAIDGENIEIQFTGPMRPFILKSVENDEILQLILPTRTY